MSLQVTATGNWSADATETTVGIAAGESALALDLPSASNVALWRPNGLGARAFYEVSVAADSITTKRRVALRADGNLAYFEAPRPPPGNRFVERI